MKRGKTKTAAPRRGSHRKAPVDHEDDRESPVQAAPAEEEKPACDGAEAMVLDGAGPSEGRPSAKE